MRSLSAVLLFFFSAVVQAQVLGFGSAPQGSIGYNMSSAIAKVPLIPADMFPGAIVTDVVGLALGALLIGRELYRSKAPA